MFLSIVIFLLLIEFIIFTQMFSQFKYFYLYSYSPSYISFIIAGGTGMKVPLSSFSRSTVTPNPLVQHVAVGLFTAWIFCLFVVVFFCELAFFLLLLYSVFCMCLLCAGVLVLLCVVACSPGFRFWSSLYLEPAGADPPLPVSRGGRARGEGEELWEVRWPLGRKSLSVGRVPLPGSPLGRWDRAQPGGCCTTCHSSGRHWGHGRRRGRQPGGRPEGPSWLAERPSW